MFQLMVQIQDAIASGFNFAFGRRVHCAIEQI
jgi:hypothetical protein